MASANARNSYSGTLNYTQSGQDGFIYTIGVNINQTLTQAKDGVDIQSHAGITAVKGIVYFTSHNNLI